MSVWNGHYACACYHPLFVFNQFDLRVSLAARPKKREYSRQFGSIRDFPVMSFSDKPLRLTVKLGMSIATISLLRWVLIIYLALSGDVLVAGGASVMASIWFLAGLIITLLGVVATYLGRTFDEAKKRPIYIIKEEIE